MQPIPPFEISRTEYETRHSELTSDIIRLESRIDVQLTQINARMSNLEISIAKQGANVWKYVAVSLTSVLLGLVPYVLHLEGVIR